MGGVVPGVYQLLVRVRRPLILCVGALGECRFAQGWYVYTGSAKAGLEQRIRRHLQSHKRFHWHIDYLLAVAHRVEVYAHAGEDLAECELHRSLRGQTPVPGFGSSDCRCAAHLAFFCCRPRLALPRWSR